MEPSRKHLSFHVLDSFVRDHIQSISEELETRVKLQGLSQTLHFILLELVGNAVKANLKRVYFKKHGYSLADPESYAKGIAEFMQAYPTINEEEYRDSLEDLDITVEITYDLNEDRLLIFVENNVILLEEEERRIRRQLAGSSDIKNIVEFSMAYGDETEGRGLGLAMIVLLMKDLGFDPGHFRVYNRDGRAVARVELPLSADYTPIRDHYRTEHPDAP